MTPEEIEALQKSITENVVAAVTANLTPPTPADPLPPDPKPAGDPPPSGGTGPTGGFTADDVALAVKGLMDKDKVNEDSKVFNMLWKEKYNQTINSVQGLDEFIKGEDDYGNVREDQLNNIESYEKRVEALTKLTNSFNEASAGSPNRRPVVNKKIEKKKQEAMDEYQKLDDKMKAGEYKNVSEMTADFFKAFNKEANGLT